MDDAKKTQRSKRMGRFGKRVVPSVLLTLIVIIVILVVQYLYAYHTTMDQKERELRAHAATVVDQLSMLDLQQSEKESSKMMVDRFSIDFVINELNRTDDVTEKIAALNHILGSDGTFVMYNASGMPLEEVDWVRFNAEEKEQLFGPDGGELHRTDWSFVSKPLNGGYLVFRNWPYDELTGIGEVIKEIGNGIVLVLTEDGKIDTNKTDPGIAYDAETIKQLIDVKDFNAIQINDDLDLIYAMNVTSEGEIVIIGESLSATLIEAFGECSVSTVLFIIVALVVMIYALLLCRRREEIGKQVFAFHTFRRTNLDRSLFTHLSALLVFALFTTGALHIYVDTLSFMSRFNMSVAEDEQDTVILSNAYEERKYYQESEIEHQCKIIAGLINWSAETTADTLSEEKLQEIRDRYKAIAEICFYDREGYLVASDSGYTGYKLEYIEGNPETECLKLLSGDNDVLITRIPNNSYQYISVRRKNGEGFIRILMYNPMAEWNETEMSEYLTGAMRYFGRGYKYYCFKNDTEQLVGMAVDYDSPDIRRITIAAEELTDGDYSFRWIDNQLQYMHVRENSTAYIIRSKPIGIYLTRRILVRLMISLIGYILLWIELVLTNGFFKADAEQISRHSDESFIANAIDKDKQLSSHFSKAIKVLISLLIFSIIAMLVIDYLARRDTSFVVFLLGNNWKRGLNIFSITNVMGLFAGEQVISFVISKTILLIANNMNAKGRTIGRMLASMVRFLLMLAVIFYSLVLFGVNITTLLTGAGIVGAALSFCAQSTVSDIISGLFIIFEGHIRVGDWVMIEGETGEVYEIGMRTSVIAKNNAFVVLNNSKMSNLKKLSPKRSGPGIELNVAYGEDLDEVIKLLNDNQKLFRKEIPAITDGPWVEGVTDLGDSGISIRLYAKSPIGKTSEAEQGMRRVSKKLFDMHHIEIPWPQIVVHNSEPVLHQEKVKDAQDGEK